jgi:hypothetical protein
MFFESIIGGFYAFGLPPVWICVIASMVVFGIHSLFLLGGTYVYRERSQKVVDWNVIQGTMLTIAVVPLVRLVFEDSGGYFPDLSDEVFGPTVMAWLAALLVGIICGYCYRNQLFMRLVTPSIVNFIQGLVAFNICAKSSISKVAQSIARNYDVFPDAIVWLGYMLVAFVIGHILLSSVVILLMVISGGSTHKDKEAFADHFVSPLSFLSGFIVLVMYAQYVHLMVQQALGR